MTENMDTEQQKIAGQLATLTSVNWQHDGTRFYASKPTVPKESDIEFQREDRAKIYTALTRLVRQGIIEKWDSDVTMVADHLKEIVTVTGINPALLENEASFKESEATRNTRRLLSRPLASLLIKTGEDKQEQGKPESLTAFRDASEPLQLAKERALRAFSSGKPASESGDPADDRIQDKWPRRVRDKGDFEPG